MAEKEKPTRRRGGNNHTGRGTSSIEKTCTATKSEISTILSHSTYWLGVKKVRTPEEMAERLNQFFARCNETGELPSVEKLALALGINAKTLWCWQTADGVSQEMADMVKQAKAILASIDAELVANRKIPETTYIFRSKNYYGLKDQQDVVVKAPDPMGEEQDPEALAAKYAATLPPSQNVTIELPKEAVKVEEEKK